MSDELNLHIDEGVAMQRQYRGSEENESFEDWANEIEVD